jgi:hypothetical protein
MRYSYEYDTFRVWHSRLRGQSNRKPFDGLTRVSCRGTWFPVLPARFDNGGRIARYRITHVTPIKSQTALSIPRPYRVRLLQRQVELYCSMRAIV